MSLFTLLQGLTDDLPADEQNNKISLLHSAAAFASAANLMVIVWGIEVPTTNLGLTSLNIFYRISNDVDSKAIVPCKTL